MRKKIVLSTGVGIAMFLGLAGFVSVNAAQSPTETESPASSVQDTLVQDILCRENGNEVQFSIGGNEWISQSEYEQSLPKTAWWTASDYEKWILEQRTELEALIGTGDGWVDGQGVYHEWTQENVNATIARYEEILSDIKAGVLYTKPNEDGIECAQFFPNIDVSSVYGADFVKSDGNTVHIGDYSTKKELQEALDNAVKNGEITQEEADSIICQ